MIEREMRGQIQQQWFTALRHAVRALKETVR
jgi:hypothetical protein